MRKKETVKIGEMSVTVDELTAAQVDMLLQASGEAKAASAIELLMDSPIPLEAVCASTGLSKQELDNMAPSDAALVWEAVARVNNFLSRMLERLAAVAAKIQPDRFAGSQQP